MTEYIKNIALKFHLPTMIGLISFIVVATWIAGATFAQINQETAELGTKYDHALRFAQANKSAIEEIHEKMQKNDLALVQELQGIKINLAEMNTVLKLRDRE